jgi:hypothetical protein
VLGTAPARNRPEGCRFLAGSHHRDRDEGRLDYGIPVAGAACWDPVNAVTAPVGVVSVT